MKALQRRSGWLFSTPAAKSHQMIFHVVQAFLGIQKSTIKPIQKWSIARDLNGAQPSIKLPQGIARSEYVPR